MQGIECPDRGVSPRQRAALVAVEPHQARRDVAFGGEPFRHDLQAHAADAQHVELRLGDAQRGRVLLFARVLPADPSRKVRGLGRKRGIGQHGQTQPMAQRVARHHRLAGARARTGAARRIGAVGGENFLVAADAHPARQRQRCIRNRKIMSLVHAASRICTGISRACLLNWRRLASWAT
jgi:hypothetical protein